jgi:hypothetical protein
MNKGFTKYIIAGVILIVAALLVGTLALKKNIKTVLAPTSSGSPSGTGIQQVTANTGSSDSQIDSDLNSVNSNLNSLNSENNQVDTGINQKAVDPTQ